MPDVTTPAPTPAAARVAVTRGDNLWRIAAVALTQHLGRAPHDDEIVPYWRRVIATNRATLRSGDPNLIYAGELIALPPLV